jgi:hypothetical protein
MIAGTTVLILKCAFYFLSMVNSIMYWRMYSVRKMTVSEYIFIVFLVHLKHNFLVVYYNIFCFSKETKMLQHLWTSRCSFVLGNSVAC